jgi:hypothetical protein
LKIPHWLHSQFIDGCKVVTFTHRSRSTPPETLFFCFWYSFMLDYEKTPRPNTAGRIR